MLEETAAIARKFKGTSSVAMVSMPRLVVGNFQRCSVYRPIPNKTAVTVVKMRNFSTGIREISAHKLTTNAVEQPMISSPPMISPQRMLLSSIKELSTSVKDFRGGRVGAAYLGSTWRIGVGLACCCADKNDGIGSITISSLLATNEEVTTEGGGTVLDGIGGTVSSVTDAGAASGRLVLCSLSLAVARGFVEVAGLAVGVSLMRSALILLLRSV